MSMPRRARSLAAALAVAALAATASSALGRPAGIVDQFSLGDDQLFQTLGQPYDVAATANGTAAIGWISASSSAQSGHRMVHLCKLEIGATSCTGGIQTIDSLAFASAGDPQVVITSDGVVHLIWWHDSSGPNPGAIAEATAPDGQNLSAGHDVAALPTSVGSLMAAKLGPGDSIWTVTYDAVPGQHIEVRPGLSAAPETVPTPFAIGYAQLAFVGDQAVLTVEEYGSISTPPYYAVRSSNGTWSSFQPLSNTWAVGTNVALATTGSGLRLVTAIGNASYRAVISKFTNGAFGKPRLTPDKNSCTPNTHDGWADASGRLLDVSWECEQVAVANYPDALHPALFRLKSGGTPTYQAQIASGTRGIATLVYTVQSATANDLRVAHVLLPDSTRRVSKGGSGGRVTVTGPRSCLPPVDVKVGWSRKAARGWTFKSGSLQLGGKAVSGPLDGGKLAPGKLYTLTATATFSKNGKNSTVTAKLKFKTCATA